MKNHLNKILTNWYLSNQYKKSDIRIELYKDLNKEALSYLNKVLFYKRGWLTTLKKTFNSELIFLQKFKTGNLFCIIPMVLCKDFKNNKYLVSLPYTPLIEDKELDYKTIFFPLMDFLVKNNLISDLIFKQKQNIIDSTNRYLINTINLQANIDQIYYKMSSFNKRFISKYKNKKIIVIEKEFSSNQDIFYTMYIDNNRRHGSPSLPMSFFVNLNKYFSQNFKLYFCYSQSKLISCCMFIYDKKVAIYSYVGINKLTKNKDFGHRYLIYKAINDFKRIGIKEINLGKTDFDQDGLIKFKKSFGSKTYEISYFSFLNQEYKLINSKNLIFRLVKTLNRYLPYHFYNLFSKLQIKYLGLQ